MAASEEKIWESLRQLDGALVVSCQASEGEPLCAPTHILALALSAINGGASGLRLEGPENIQLVRNNTSLPIVGLTKSPHVPPGERLKRVYITASFEEARAVSEAGADIVALDATGRPRPDGSRLPELIERVHAELGKPVWADVSSLSEALAAWQAGADAVSTTLAGYTEETRSLSDEGPALTLLADLCRQLPIPVALEGRVWHPDEVRRAFELGAYSVVVGSAITRPHLITSRFVRAIPVRVRSD